MCTDAEATDSCACLQTDWALSRMGIRIGSGDDAPTAVVPLTELGSKLGMNSSAKIYGTFIPLEVPDGVNTPRGISSAVFHHYCVQAHEIL